MTPGEAEQALELGCRIAKLFPASVAGGVEMIKALAGPYAHTPLRLVPLGGVNEATMADFLAQPLVIAVGGSWLTDRKLAAAGKWSEITALTARAMAIAAGAAKTK
jgi:2-dehydro-3-deoxyphosphogluconate aldolase/(4S)-4-hydroxy-2-oxoglutarate aldolase